MNRIQIHEDDEGMRSLHPMQAIDEITAELLASSKHSEENRSPVGVGWTEVHAIRSPEAGFDSLHIPVLAVAEALEKHLPRIREFELGWGQNNPFHYLEADAYCFGLGTNLYVKIDVNNGLIESIWYEARPKDHEELTRLRQAIESINDVIELSCADYWLHMGGAIDDREFMDRYFGMIAQTSYERQIVNKPMAAPRPANGILAILQRLFGNK